MAGEIRFLALLQGFTVPVGQKAGKRRGQMDTALHGASAMQRGYPKRGVVILREKRRAPRWAPFKKLCAASCAIPLSED
jgi:hypothetical protein